MALCLAAAAGLVWANIPGHSYADLWNRQAPWSSPLGLSLSARDWVNQALLFAFFALVGLEMRREVSAGELRSVRRAVVPVGAAVVGMAVPAVIYTAVVAGGPGAHGWGIPMATDVAFALGALALIGPHASRGRVFLLTLAVADDLLSIVVLVVIYRTHTDLTWLAVGAFSTGTASALWWQRRGTAGFRVALMALAWWAMLHAGIEAAVFGAVLGVVGPSRSRPSWPSRVRRWELRLQPPVNLVILPVFALANVGVTLGRSTFSSTAALRIFFAVLGARALGKPIGVAAGSFLIRRLMRSRRPVALPARHLGGVATLASIGFTVPLLIISRALPAGPLAAAATAGLLAGSVAGVAGAAGFLRVRRPGRTGLQAPP